MSDHNFAKEKRDLKRASKHGVWNTLAEDELFDIIRLSADRYDERLDREYVCELSGRHIPAVEDSVQRTIDWLQQSAAFVATVFGTSEFLRQAMGDGSSLIRASKGPVVTVLPRNDRGDLAPYVLAQVVLSRSPFVVHPSSREAGTYVAETYVDCLSAAVDAVLDQERSKAVRSSMAVVSSDSRHPSAHKLDRLVQSIPDGGQFIIFGSDSSLATIEARLEESEIQLSNVVQMGTGKSASALVAIDPVDRRTYVEAIAESAVFDKGDDCTATSILYVDAEIYPEVIDDLELLKNDLHGGDPWDRGAAFAASDRDDSAFQEAAELAQHHLLSTTFEPDRLNVVQLRGADPVFEYPIPVVQVKRIRGVDELVQTMRTDLGGEPNLVTSVFSSASEPPPAGALSPLPTHLIRYNAPTHEIDLMHEHQGTYLVEDLLASTRIEQKNDQRDIF